MHMLIRWHRPWCCSAPCSWRMLEALKHSSGLTRCIDKSSCGLDWVSEKLLLSVEESDWRYVFFANSSLFCLVIVSVPLFVFCCLSVFWLLIQGVAQGWPLGLMLEGCWYCLHSGSINKQRDKAVIVAPVLTTAWVVRAYPNVRPRFRPGVGWGTDIRHQYTFVCWLLFSLNNSKNWCSEK